MAEGGNAPLVLVTGASGYVASHCIKNLLEGGEYRVKGTVRSLKNEAVCEALTNLVPDASHPLELVEADLLDEASWKSAVEGCTYVLHVASPFIFGTPKHEDDLIKPAVEGTLNVLKACKEVGGVKRVVLTSSVAAITVGNLEKELSDEDWSDVKKASAYEKSKSLAEKAAWDFVKELPDEKKFELVTINPGFIIGPLLIKKECASSDLIKQILLREMSAVPDIHMATIDVRDVAEAHIKSITNPDAAGNRHILSAAKQSYSFLQLADTLAKEFNGKGFNVPTRKVPKPLLWLASWFKKDVRNAYPYIGVPWKMNNDRMKNVLSIEGRSIDEAVVCMAQSMLDLGMIQKSPENAHGKATTTKDDKAAKDKPSTSAATEDAKSADVVKEGDAKEGDAKEGDAKEGDAKEGDAKEGDAKEGDAKEGDAKEGDAKEGDAKEGDANEKAQNVGEEKEEVKVDAKKEEEGGNGEEPDKETHQDGNEKSDSKEEGEKEENVQDDEGTATKS